MKYCLLLIFACLAFNSNAATTTIAADTNIRKLDYKQSKQYFLENYGKDDSTKALINYFFRKRKTAFYQTVIPVVVGGGLTILLVNALNKSNNVVSSRNSGYGGLIIPLALVTVVLQSSGQLIAGQITLLLFNRHKLLKLLDNYNAGKHLPKKIRHRKQFEQELDKLQGKSPRFSLF